MQVKTYWIIGSIALIAIGMGVASRFADASLSAALTNGQLSKRPPDGPAAVAPAPAPAPSPGSGGESGGDSSSSTATCGMVMGLCAGSCPSGSTCESVSGSCNCVIAPTCTENSDCPYGKICLDGECSDPVGCDTHSDCPVGFYCDEPLCIEISEPVECHYDSDCPSDKYCEDFKCKSYPAE